MGRLTPIERLDAEIEKILAEYADEVSLAVDDVTVEVAKQGAKAVKGAAASAYGGGKYSRSWTTTIEKKRTGTVATIHSNLPGLPHLLEKGHAKRNGGRVAGREHIAPVEEEIAEKYLKAVEDAL